MSDQDTYVAEIINPENLLNENTLSDLAIKVYSRSRTIRFLSVFHGILNIFNALFQNWFFAFISLLCYFGYKGAKDYNNKYTVFYFIYVIMDFIGQITMLVTIENNKDNIDANNDQWVLFYIIQALVFFTQIWIICIVYNFMKNLKELTENELNILRGNNPLQNVRLVFI